jgi:hypothetical protein
MPPAELVGLFDDATRIHMLDLGPATELVDVMESAWWAAEDCWELEWVDTARC